MPPISRRHRRRRYLGRPWNGQRVQVRTIVDTLATRKLLDALAQRFGHRAGRGAGVFDMMMRPNSATTFSNFDHLPHTLPKVLGFPADAVLRTDRKGVAFPQDLIASHIDIFAEGRAKELLITPNGVRIVCCWPRPNAHAMACSGRPRSAMPGSIPA
ncbi:hypothetical protein ACVOMV_20450 [Mesorhizobium atlanticum]